MSETQEEKKTVTDVHGHDYQLKSILGRGGQGAVWQTEHSNVLIKLSTVLDESKRNSWQDHIAWLMRRDLKSLKLALPLATLEAPDHGYVMELMEGLVPLSGLLETQFLQNAEGYLATGGLSRRLRLLKQLASTLTRLHGRGMQFGDLSPSNIFISAEPRHAEVWLIDCDNISLEAKPCQPLYTQDYGAPELVRGDAPASTLTDAWSFAVIAYQMLTINHPLKGDMILDGEAEYEEGALRGEFPWINDPSDDSNRSYRNIPEAMVTTPRLSRLFAECFGKGKGDPLERPSMASWLEAFQEACERTVNCSHCTSTYLFTTEKRCPFCDASLDNDYILLQEFDFIPLSLLPEDAKKSDRLTQTGRFVLLQPGDEVDLRQNLPTFMEGMPHASLARLAWHENDLWIDPLESPVSLQRAATASPVKARLQLKGEFRGNDQSAYWLIIGDKNQPMVMWRFTW